MSRKFSAARRNAFLRALGETGNQTIAAERAKVSRSWVCLHRSTDPAFDAACREAIAVAKMMLRDDCSGKPADPKWRWHDGAELVVEGTNGRRVQVRRARLSQWTPRVEQRFLSVLAGTCNVKAACREVGLWPPSAYNRRKRFPGFARAWDQAVEIGMCELESRVNQNIGYFFDRELPEPDAPIQDISVTDAIRLMRMYERRAEERSKGRPSRE